MRKLHKQDITEILYGATLLGAGGGGFMLLYVPQNKQAEVRQALREYREISFSFEAAGSQIIFINQ